jgi:8-oxo-dGTP diphosphatase
MNHDNFIKFPTGKNKGKFCTNCMRYNARYVTCDILAIKNNKILLVLRKKDPDKDKYCLPGGYLNWDENLIDCANRELIEETGYEAKNLELFTILDDPHRPDGRQNITIVYITKDIKKIKDFQDDETIEIKFFDINKINKMNLAFDHNKVIKQFINK